MERCGFHITSDNILFFDFDGTLVDTNYANFLAYSKAIKSVKDVTISCEFVGRFNRNLLKRIMPNLNDNEYHKIVYEKEKCYNSFLSETEIRVEIVGVLCRFFETNRIVLVTNSRKKRALDTLSYHGLLDKFDDLVFYEENDIFPNKFVKALAVLQLPADHVVLFEDDNLQLKCAGEAGIRCLNPIIL